MREFIGNIIWILVAMVGSGAGYTIAHKLTGHKTFSYFASFAGFIAAVLLFALTR